MLRIGVIMYQTSQTKGQELVAQRTVREFRRQGHEAFLITSVYHDWEPVVSIEEVKKRGGYIHSFDTLLGIPVIRVNSEAASWPPRRVSFVDFMGVLTSIVEDLKLNVLITHSTLWNGPEEVVKFVEWRRNLVEAGSHPPLFFCHMSHLQEPSDERYEIYERSYREAWNDVSLSQLVKNADFILVTTPGEAEYLKKFGAGDDKFMLFPGGVDADAPESVEAPQKFREKYRLPKNSKIVSYLGTVEERKNVLALLEVAQLLKSRKDIHFVIAGTLEREYGQKVKEAAGSLSNVSLIGPISEEDKIGLIGNSFLNITLSRSEALGISQLEFMSAGVPVITSGVGGQSWVVKNGETGIIVQGPDDVVGAADAVKRMVDRPSVRDRLGKSAISFASRFSTTRLVSRLASKLEILLGESTQDVKLRESIPREERVIESWINKGQRVVATSKSLVIGSVEGGKEAIAIPYNEIARIVRHVKATWLFLGIGTAVTMFLLVLSLTDLVASSFLGPFFAQGLSRLGLSWLSGAQSSFFPFLPLIVSIAAFLFTVREGYLIHYGQSSTIFLSKEFMKALKLADKLTPHELFSEPV
ncbi:MAG: glycosyltransferase family 4 protein [Thaumarchaeota archaeon]|nr:glycosyltransferase family 4 protein [Nitrososphaerota archaeon]